MKSLLSYIFLVLWLCSVTRSQAQSADSKEIMNMLSFYVGPKFGYGSADFTKNYFQYFGGRNNEYDAKLAIGGSAKFEFIEGIRFGMTAEYANTGFTEMYTQSVRSSLDSQTIGQRAIEQQLAINSIPVLLTAEFVPSSNQFRTYVGGGLGINIGKITWTEKLRSSFPNDIRTGGEYINSTLVGPAFTLYSGIEMSFDKKLKQSVIAGILIEARYVYSGLDAPFFEKAKTQFVNPPASWNDTFYAGTSSFAVNVGVFFQFMKQAKKISQ
ncbi:MAG TPA: outer membrane beta-barrel protein [Candidatus Kapabacteria bacterium]|nr:hypothetical protein [Ignavibacteria bacterium]HRK59339.1 outer membrane beta-barrel protein [Candidatus Kapabacteria bacterium]